MIDLNTKIDSALGWTLSSAYSINDDGKIVGYGTQAGGYMRAFLLDPTK
jgi:probable HAF family extracellular repeat protein